MQHYVILIVWLILSRLSNSEMDNIARRQNKSWATKKWFKWIMVNIFRIKDYDSFIYNWYLANNWKPDPKWNILGINIKKTFLAFTLDGWHFHKFIMLYTVSILAADYLLYLNSIENLLYSILGGFIFTFILGATFEFFYEDYVDI